MSILFGGGNGGNFPAVRYSDTWVFSSPTGWSQVFPATSPSARQGAGIAYDPVTRTIVLFGGFDANLVDLNDTWTWDGTTWTQQFPPVSPPAREIDTQGMTFDPSSRTVLMFGGFTGTNDNTTQLGDTWEWNGRSKTWTQKFPAASPPPTSPTVAYDARHGYVLLFSGNNSNQTWTWNGTIWTQLFPNASPSARLLNSMAYDPSIGSIVLYGGTPGFPEGFDDTWLWTGTTWLQLQTSSEPSARWSSAMVYDPNLKGLLLSGGYLAGDVLTNQTWIFSAR